MKVLISIERKWFDKNKKKLIEKSAKQLEVPSIDAEYLIEGEVKYETCLSESGKFIEVIIEKHEGVYVSLEVPLSEKLLTEITGVILKKLNKFRTVLEALNNL